MDEKTKKILVVDDDEAICNVIKDFLEEQGYVVDVATTGYDGLYAVEKVKPDLIILDVDLPDINGFEVCKRIKGNGSSVHIPVLMLTAHSGEANEVTGFESGADDFVGKPFRPGRLLARIHSAIVRTDRGLDANALTHLPGNIAISQEMEKRIEEGGPFSVLYFDLNNFKEFNDRYGFMRGDEAIKLTGSILSQAFSKVNHRHSFLGHIGGDDFVGIVGSHDVEELTKGILREFDEKILTLYDETDRKKRKITSVDRKGKKAEIPIMGMAVAIITNRKRQFKHPGEISFISGDLKKWVKAEKGSTYLIDRRTTGG